MALKLAGLPYSHILARQIKLGKHLQEKDVTKVRKYLGSTEEIGKGLDFPETQADIEALQAGTFKSYDERLEKVRQIAMDTKHFVMLSDDDAMLKKLPKTFFEITEFDSFRDEGLLFYDRLTKLGVKTELSYQKNFVHVEGIIQQIAFLPESNQHAEALAKIVKFCKDSLKN